MPLCARNDGKKNIKSRRMQDTLYCAEIKHARVPMQTYSTIGPLVIPLCGEVRMSLKTIVLFRATTKNVKITCLTPHMSYPTPNRFTVYTLSPLKKQHQVGISRVPKPPQKRSWFPRNDGAKFTPTVGKPAEPFPQRFRQF